MQTRRDQLQAYRYLLRRVLASMLGTEPEAVEQPMSRVTTSTFAGIMVGVVACAGVALFGYFAHKGATGWKSEPYTLITEKETNARYVFLKRSDFSSSGQPTSPSPDAAAGQPPAAAQGTGEPVADKEIVLVPVLNYTSASLILGKEPTEKRVSRTSLEGIARAPRVGIPLAPNSLPDKENVVSSPWTVCSTSRLVDEQPRTDVELLIGTPEKRVGARRVGERALLVRAGSGAEEPTYLVWKGKRLRTDPVALRSIELSPSSAIPVGAAWLDGLEAGQPLQAPIVPNRQQPSSIQIAGASTTIGQIFHTPSPDAFYVMLEDGLAPITEVQKNLLLGSGAAEVDGQPQSNPTEIGIGDVTQNASQTDMSVGDLPTTTPPLVDVDATAGVPVCLWYDSETGARITTGGTLPESVTTGGSDGEAGDQSGDGSGGAGDGSNPFADQVVVPPGRIGLVRLQPSPEVKSNSFFLITEDGEKFPVPNAETLGALGYTPDDAVEVPPSLLRLVPQGPALTKEAALKTARFVPESGPAGDPAAGEAGK